MKVFLPLLGMMLSVAWSRAAAAEKWETCLDKGDFTYGSEDSILMGTSTNVTKTGCRFVFSVLGGKGEKYEIDVCDPSIHVDHFATLDSAGHRVLADVAGCPAPTFGADFDANAKLYNEYKETRTKVFGLFEKIRDFYAEELTKANITNPYDKSNITALETKDYGKVQQELRDARLTAGREACAHFLLHEYLNRCMSFEGHRPEALPAATAPAGAPLIGVHPQTILKK
jgi:hypothetical protein